MPHIRGFTITQLQMYWSYISSALSHWFGPWFPPAIWNTYFKALPPLLKIHQLSILYKFTSVTFDDALGIGQKYLFICWFQVHEMLLTDVLIDIWRKQTTKVPFQYKDFPCIRIPIIKTWHYWDHLKFIMRIPILIRWCPIIEIVCWMLQLSNYDVLVLRFIVFISLPYHLYPPICTKLR